jgi:hypothetical protein
MIKRFFAVAVVATAALAAAAVPASAQTYPPPSNSITVDDSTPAAGQAVTVTLRTCRRGTVALLGIGLSLVGAPTVGSDGVARATVTVPARLRPGRHVVSGACLSPTWRPLFLTTVITVSAVSGGGGGGGGAGAGGGTGSPGGSGGGTAAAPAGTAAAGGAASAGGGAGAGSTGGGTAAPSLADLAGPQVPADAPVLFEETAQANGVTDDGAGSATPAASDAGRQESPSEPGTMSTIARVALGIAALGGVPVALAFSRRPPRRSGVQQGFA